MLKEAFEIYDALAVEKKEKEKKDGLVTEHNLGYILRSIGQNPTEAQVKQFFAKYAKGDTVCPHSWIPFAVNHCQHVSHCMHFLPSDR